MYSLSIANLDLFEEVDNHSFLEVPDNLIKLRQLPKIKSNSFLCGQCKSRFLCLCHKIIILFNSGFLRLGIYVSFCNRNVLMVRDLEV